MENLPKIVKRGKKRVGRGYSSGKGGHTTGRGQKGQKSRSSIHILFEGVKVRKSFVKRLPLKRGKAKFSAGKKPLIVKLRYLNMLADKSKVDIETLIKNGIVDSKTAKKFGVKILGNGKLEKSLEVVLPISKSAAKKVEKAGGSVKSE